MTTREHSVIAAFISIANNLVGEFDLSDLLGGLAADCTRLLDVQDAGLLLADGAGVLQVAAATSEHLRLVQQVQLDHHEGPCPESFARGTAVQAPDLSGSATEWPAFVPAAGCAGYAAAHALPLRLQNRTLGVLGLFSSSPGVLNPEDLKLAQALAHAASIALVVHQAAADQARVNSQLQLALNSRVVLEQAKGMIAACGNLDMNQAFDALRRFSRNHNRKLTSLAQGVVERSVPPHLVLEQTRRSGQDRPSGPRSQLGTGGQDPTADHGLGQVVEPYIVRPGVGAQ